MCRSSATCWRTKDSVQKIFLAFSTQMRAKPGHIGDVHVVAICVIVTAAISDNGAARRTATINRSCVSAADGREGRRIYDCER